MIDAMTRWTVVETVCTQWHAAMASPEADGACGLFCVAANAEKVWGGRSFMAYGKRKDGKDDLPRLEKRVRCCRIIFRF
ncbi:hypothetical protein B5G09_11930 [Alistipes sp. An54]|uniref:hypothetical protein n=1 Tax=Alistipes sp. An54 TaxID=1965645 RepID=UPI000B575565|nr:hypothetical protein [Alistipes sp. An54]OUN75955.1 hypothetical protein B5G09_11930 [Alistipes sp. An54]